MIVLKHPDEVETMYRANQIVARLLERLGEWIHPGVTTLVLLERYGEAHATLERGLAVHPQQPDLSQALPFDPAVTTGTLDRVAESFVRDHGAVPAFKGYRGYPATLCTSVNEVVVHGIPSTQRLKTGDLISIDVGVVLEGFYGDAAKTYPVGNVSGEPPTF